jgi:hypothetical protein
VVLKRAVDNDLGADPQLAGQVAAQERPNCGGTLLR